MEIKKLMVGIILGMFLLYPLNGYAAPMSEKQRWEKFCQKIYMKKKKIYKK